MAAGGNGGGGLPPPPPSPWYYHHHHFNRSFYGPHKNGTNDHKLEQDIHYSMSKKIAQLTKVIYDLNTKCDDQELCMNATKKTNEEKLQQIVQQTKTKIEFYKSKVGKEAEMKQQIDSLHASVNEHRKYMQQLKQELLTFRQEEAENRADGTGNESTRLAEELRIELDKVKSDRQRQINLRVDLEKRLKEAERSNEEESKPEVDQTSSENVRMRAEYETKIQNLNVVYKNKCLDEVRTRERLLDSERKMEREREVYRKEMNELEKRNQELESGMGDLQERCGHFEKRVESIRGCETSVQEVGTDRIETRTKERVKQILWKLSQSEERSESFSKENRKLLDVIGGKKSEIETLNEQLTNSKSDANRSNQQLKQTETNWAKEKRCRDQLLHQLQTQHEESVDRLESEKSKMQADLKETQTHVYETTERLKNSVKNKEELKMKRDQQRKESQRNINELEKLLSKSHEREQKTKQEYDKEFKCLKENYGLREQHLRSDYESRINELQENVETEQIRKFGEYETSIDENKQIISNLTKEVMEVAEENRTLCRRLEEEAYRSKQTIAEKQTEVEKLNDQLTAVTSLKEDLEKQMGATRQEVREVSKKYDAIEAECQELKVMLANSREENVRLKEEFMETTRNEVEEAVRQQKSRMQLETDSKVSQLEEETSAMISSEEKKWKDKIDQIHSQMNSDMEKLEDQLKSTDDEKQTIEGEHRKEIETLKEKWNDEDKQFRQTIIDLNSSNNRMIKSQLQKAQNDLQEQKRQLTAGYEQSVRRTKEENEQESRNQRHAWVLETDGKIEALRREHSLEISKMKSSLEEEASFLIENEMKKSKNQLETAEGEIKHIMCKLNAKGEQMSHLKEEHIRQMEEKNSTVERMMIEVAQTQSKLQAQIEEKNRFSEQQQKQIETELAKQRQPRNEDLALIQQLRNILIERDTVIHKCNEEKRRLYMEISHRENMCRKMMCVGHGNTSVHHGHNQIRKKSTPSNHHRFSVPVFRQGEQFPAASRVLQPVEFKSQPVINSDNDSGIPLENGSRHRDQQNTVGTSTEHGINQAKDLYF
ncbi:Uncharacterised protein g4553 [Pycnogonum litorale]